MKKLVTAQIQTAIPRETVMKRVGTSTRRATPIQKSENTSAVIRERRSVPIVKERKSARGVKERRSWMKRNACLY